MIAGLAACSGGTETPSSLSITPSNPGTLRGPQLFTAVVVNDDASVTWALTSGQGSLSSTTGRNTTYSPPAAGASGNITITATTSDGLTATVSATIAPPAIPSGTIPSLSAAVQISYDPQDVPHLTCATENDCLEAQGYLQARDRLFQMDLFRRTARGQLSTMIGSLVSGDGTNGLEVGSDKQFLAFFTTRDGAKIEDQLVSHLDADTASKIGAFVNGINAYIHELKNNPSAPLPGEYAQLPYPLKASDIPDWTAQDTLAIGRLQQFQLSETIEEEAGYGTFAAAYAPGGVLNPINGAPNAGLLNAYVRAQDTERSYTLPIQTGARTVQAAQASPVDSARLSDFAGAIADARNNVKQARGLLGQLGIDTGSNNWVVDGAHSATGQAMVANDPHLALQYPPLFHLIAMTASDASGLDMQGGSFPGIPGALIGRGKHVGWGVTVVGYDVTDLYTENVVACSSGSGQVPCVNFDPGDGNGSRQVPLTVVPVTINVRQPSGALAPVSYAVYVNKYHGPFISYNPGTGKAISMRWTGAEITSDLRAFLHLNVATSIGGVADATTSGSTTAFAALHDMATGAQNFVLADDTGNIGYDPHALVPKRNWAGLNGRYPWFPLPGDGSAEWGSGNPADNCAGAPGTTGALPSANCWYADADLPHADASNNVASGTGFLVTANADPGGYGDSNVPVSVRHGAPFYLSFDWDEQTGCRHKQITNLLSAATAGGRKVSMDDMAKIQSNHTSLLASAFIPTIDFIVSQIPAGHAPPEVAAARAMLDAWNTAGLDCPTGLTGTSPSSAVSTDATVQINSQGCLLFHTFIRVLINNVFNDEFKVIGASPDTGAALRAMLYMLRTTNLTNNTDQNFCNNTTGPGVATPVSCPTQVVTALATAYDELAGYKGATSNWIWGRVHTLTTSSPASPIVDGTFGGGPYARPGGLLTIDVGNPSFSSGDPLNFSYGSGSNVRFIAEMNPAAANTKMQLPGPERDAPHGVFESTPDLLLQYVQNQYFDFAYSAQGSASAVSTQTLSPTAAQ